MRRDIALPCSDSLRCYFSFYTVYYNYVSYFVVKCDLALLLPYDKVCAKSFNVTPCHLLCITFSFLKVTLDFSISDLNSLHFSFLLANKRSGMSGGYGGYQFTKIKYFSIIIIKAVMEE